MWYFRWAFDLKKLDIGIRNLNAFSWLSTQTYPLKYNWSFYYAIIASPTLWAVMGMNCNNTSVSTLKCQASKYISRGLLYWQPQTESITVRHPGSDLSGHTMHPRYHTVNWGESSKYFGNNKTRMSKHRPWPRKWGAKLVYLCIWLFDRGVVRVPAIPPLIPHIHELAASLPISWHILDRRCQPPIRRSFHSCSNPIGTHTIQSIRSRPSNVWQRRLQRAHSLRAAARTVHFTRTCLVRWTVEYSTTGSRSCLKTIAFVGFN